MSIEGTIHRLAETENENANMKINQTTQMLRVIRNTFQFLDKNIFIPLYKTMVKSHFDYAASVWNPYLKNTIAIESVQRRATKLIPGMKDKSYPQRLNILHLPTLTYRRLRGDMIEVLQIMIGIYDTKQYPNYMNGGRNQTDKGTEATY